ncbi:hypothetical protein PIB30_021123 [Stylosanthes scabra]|uniref:FAR1 domain-containing protein n=1 Tax=Stylosanthes scabra TaxID=79078 RepID=A0ABU6Q8J7_9FABA|nr:hypothetical protein [Stylosanthes scabra]
MAIDFDINIEPPIEEDICSLNIFNDSENIVMNTNNIEVIEQPTTNHNVDPKEGMCFGTLEKARDYYQRYAETVGFVVKIRNTNWETKNGDRGNPNRLRREQGRNSIKQKSCHKKLATSLKLPSIGLGSSPNELTHGTILVVRKTGVAIVRVGFSSSRATVLGLWNMDKSSMFTSLRTHSLWRNPGVYRRCKPKD